MSVALADPPTRPSSSSAISPARQLQRQMAAIRVSFVWFGVRKSLTAEQRAVAAESFGAEGEFLSVGKKLLNTNHPAFKAVTAIKSKVVKCWRHKTLPFPEPGVRLIRQDNVASFSQQLTEFRDELHDAVDELASHYSEIRREARDRLGSLYDADDYPESLRGLFQLDWDFPSVDPPEYLRRLAPDLYQEECQRVQARFQEAVQLAEQAFTAEFSKLVAHLCERLDWGGPEGARKVFRDSAVANLREFFNRFQVLNVGSCEELDDLIERARSIVEGVQPDELRNRDALRERVAQQLGQVRQSLDVLMVDAPRRRILRRPQSAETTT